MSLEINDFQATFNRLKDACGVKNQSELADLLDMSKAGISHSVQRDRLPLEWILKAHYKLGVNARYVLDGELPKHVSMRTQHEQESGAGTMQAGDTIYVQVPIMDAFLDKNGNYKQVGGDVPPYVFISRDKMMQCASKIDNLIGVKVASSEMEPTLSKNDLLVVNKEDVQPEPNSLFLFHSDGYCFPRRVTFIKGKFYVQDDSDEEQELFSKVNYDCLGKIAFYCHYLC